MEQTEEFHREQLKSKPNDPNTHNNYGAFLANVRKDFDRAMRAYRTALDLDQDHSLALGNYAVLLWRHQGDLDEAEHHLRRAIVVDPDQLLNYPKYAEFLWEVRGNFVEAEAIYRKGLSIDSKNAPLLLSFAGFNIMLREYSEAKRYYEAYLEINPRDPDALTDYASATFLSGGGIDLSIALYRQALAERPDSPFALINLAGLLFCRPHKGGLHDREAAERVEQCLALQPDKTIQLEAWFYRFAHVPRDRREALQHLRSLLSVGARSPGWDLSCNVERAVREEHPERELVAAVAEVITGMANIDSLARFPVWRGLV
jgi:Tfp pilus assembly protein PilF